MGPSIRISSGRPSVVTDIGFVAVQRDASGFPGVPGSLRAVSHSLQPFLGRESCGDFDVSCGGQARIGSFLVVILVKALLVARDGRGREMVLARQFHGAKAAHANVEDEFLFALWVEFLHRESVACLN